MPSLLPLPVLPTFEKCFNPQTVNFESLVMQMLNRMFSKNEKFEIRTDTPKNRWSKLATLTVAIFPKLAKFH